MNRFNFIKKFLSLVGIGFILPTSMESCSNEDGAEVPDEVVLTPEEIEYKNLKDKTSENGFALEGRILYIDITNEHYSALNTVGEHINDSDQYILLLRKDLRTIQAFSNCCPHLGTSNQWTYSNGTFRCGNHGNRYGTNSGNVARCGSRSTSGNLKQYSTLLNQDILTVDFNS